MARRFTEKETKEITEGYQAGMSLKDLGDKYNRNPASIVGKLKTLGIFKHSKTYYSKEDVEFLQENYPSGNHEIIFQRFPLMTLTALRSTCSKLGIKANYYHWTSEEERIVENNYLNKSPEEMTELLNNKFTYDAIQTKAFRKFNYSKNMNWTDEEIEIIKQYYSIEPIEEVLKKLPNRTRNGLIKKANQLNIKAYSILSTKWDKKDKQFVIDNWETMSDKQLSEKLGKKEQSIKDKRFRLSFSRCKHYNEASYSDLNKYLRGQIGLWKSNSMKSCNYKCILTGSKDFAIHHLHSFTVIIKEIIDENDFQLKENFCDYTIEELKFITEKVIKKHKEYPLGVCVKQNLHKLFHREYGQITNSKMWNDFVENYRKGKYTNKIDK